MTVKNVTLNIPGDLYTQIRERAERRHHSVEDETLELLATAVPRQERLPGELSAAVEQLALLDDENLWRAARSHLEADTAAELESLHSKQQGAGLTTLERQTMDGLERQYERAMLLRAQAAALLRQRGHDVASLLAPQ